MGRVVLQVGDGAGGEGWARGNLPKHLAFSDMLSGEVN